MSDVVLSELVIFIKGEGKGAEFSGRKLLCLSMPYLKT
jgi:hypothetical protein